VLGFFGSLPFWIIDSSHMGLTDSVFESVSGFTTTGASAISNLAALPASLLYYRQQLQFLGGMGIIVLAVAILPMLGIGGMQLYRAETPGPMKEDKITPRITETAKAIWFIYVGLVVLCTLAYWLAGMPLFDALEESYATLSTGGFTIHNTSFAFYHSATIEWVAIVFMFLGGVNFSLYYVALVRGALKQFWQDTEFMAYFFIVLICGVVTCVVLWLYHVYGSTGTDVVQAFFSLVSLMTTTGFVATKYAQWPLFVPVLILCLGLLGACGGSTSGGMKVIRAVILKKQFSIEMKKLTHPQGVYPLKLGRRVISGQLINSVWAFVSAYIGLLFIGTILIMATGVGLQSAFGAEAACLGNIGAGIGQYAYSFAGLDAFSKWVLVFSMLAGRLEVFTILLLFTRAFWRR
jgi:trk system potassium uptake protein TrkH